MADEDYKKDVVTFILAAGEASRFDYLPKWLVPVQGKSMLEYTVDSLYEAGLRKIIVIADEEYKLEMHDTLEKIKKKHPSFGGLNEFSNECDDNFSFKKNKFAKYDASDDFLFEKFCEETMGPFFGFYGLGQLVKEELTEIIPRSDKAKNHKSENPKYLTEKGRNLEFLVTSEIVKLVGNDQPSKAFNIEEAADFLNRYFDIKYAMVLHGDSFYSAPALEELSKNMRENITGTTKGLVQCYKIFDKHNKIVPKTVLGNHLKGFKKVKDCDYEIGAYAFDFKSFVSVVTNNDLVLSKFAKDGGGMNEVASFIGYHNNTFRKLLRSDVIVKESKLHYLNINEKKDYLRARKYMYILNESSFYMSGSGMNGQCEENVPYRLHNLAMFHDGHDKSTARESYYGPTDPKLARNIFKLFGYDYDKRNSRQYTLYNLLAKNGCETFTEVMDVLRENLMLDHDLDYEDLVEYISENLDTESTVNFLEFLRKRSLDPGFKLKPDLGFLYLVAADGMNPEPLIVKGNVDHIGNSPGLRDFRKGEIIVNGDVSRIENIQSSGVDIVVNGGVGYIKNNWSDVNVNGDIIKVYDAYDSNIQAKNIDIVNPKPFVKKHFFHGCYIEADTISQINCFGGVIVCDDITDILSRDTLGAHGNFVEVDGIEGSLTDSSLVEKIITELKNTTDKDIKLYSELNGGTVVAKKAAIFNPTYEDVIVTKSFDREKYKIPESKIKKIKIK